jgi:small subunit ribosomal protein S20
MANNPQARKRARQSERHTVRNTERTSRIRTYVKKVEQAIAAKDKTAAEAALKEAQPEIMRGVTRQVLHRNTASRKISRLAKRISAL